MTKVTKHMKKSFKDMYEKDNLSLNKIGKRFSLDPSTIQYHLKKQGVRIRLGGRYSNKACDSARISKEKAYILGVVGPGDGYVLYQRAKAYRIGLRTVDIEFAEKFKADLERIYGLKCSLNVERMPVHQDVYTVILHSKEACEDLLSYVKDIKELKEKTWRVPEIINEFSYGEKALYIQGFADSQGCVNKNGFSRMIKLSAQNREGLEQIKSLLLSLNIRCFISDRKKGKDIVITGFHNFKRFRNNISFTINSKRNKLNNIINGYKYAVKKERTQPSIVENLLPEMIKLRKSGLSYGNIAKKFNLDKGTVHRRLVNNLPK